MARAGRRNEIPRSFVQDRLLLLAAAAVVLVVLLCYFALCGWLGLSDDLQFLIAQTLGLAVFAASSRRFSPFRRRKLRLVWPLVTTAFGLLALHLATVGAYVISYHPAWRAPHWQAATILELVVFFIVLDGLNEYCTMDHRPPFTSFLARHLRIAAGDIGSG